MDEQEKQDAALGRVVRGGWEELLDRFKIHIFIGLLATLGGWGVRELTHFSDTPLPAATTSANIPDEQLQTLVMAVKQVHRDVVKVQVVTQAIVDCLPEVEKNKAKGLIADRMSVLDQAYANTAQ